MVGLLGRAPYTSTVDTSIARAPIAGPTSRQAWKGYFKANSILMAVVHLVVLVGLCFAGWSWQGFILAIVSYYIRMILVTAGYNRYFSHRSFGTSRPVQFLLALGAQSSAQKGVLWWAGHHRWHHRYSDTERDVHSPKQRGFWYAHMGWLFNDSWNHTDPTLVPDFYKFPDLRWLDRDVYQLLPAFALGLAFLLYGGLHGLLWGFMLPTVMLWHGSFSINSLTHVFGSRRYATSDESRNSWILAIVTTGEGWHNNHHHYASSSRQGFFWWEIDLTYYVLWLLARLGFVWDVRRAPERVVQVSIVARASQEASRSAA